MALPRLSSRVAVLALTAGLLAGVTGTGSAYAAEAPVAGGLTASPPDSLFPRQGNSGYDAQHYDIDFEVDVAVSAISNAAASATIPAATATIDAVTTGAPLSSYSFDFQGSTGDLAAATFNVESVTVDGVAASFSRIETTTTSNATTDQHKLVVTPATPVDGVFTTVVTYSGKPVAHTDTDGSSEGWNNTTDGATFLNQPVGAMTLFPHNNTPRDKATYTFTVDIPSTLRTSNLTQAGGKAYASAVVSNGELVSRTPSADGLRTTWVWDQQEQMASELSMISIGRYDMYSSMITLASGRTIPEWTFIDPAISTASQTTTLSTRAQLTQMLDFFESRYGPYPGNSTGLVTDVVPSAINYALETQDRSFFPTSAGRSTTYHEVMHQWFGDNVSPADWNDIWLNEGPATYAESQFPFEGAGSGTTPVETTIFNSWNNAAPTNNLWNTPVAAMSTASQLFGNATYTRGNMTLEALRTAIGAADFATLMQTWQVQYGGTSKRTADFIALAESISGRDLTAFFASWIYTSGKPAWPVKFNLSVTGPDTLVAPGDPVTYTVSARNTGKVTMPAGGTTVTVDLAEALDDATIGALPADTTLDGTTLTWSVPATALATSSSVSIPLTTNAGTDGATLRAVARAVTLGGTCLECAPATTVGAAPISPAPVPTITGLTSGAPVVGQTLTADTTGWADGTAFSYQWFIDGTPVPGATSATFTPTGTVVGLALTVAVSGTLSGNGVTSASSAPTAPGVRATQPVATPTISGTPKIGERLTVDPGAWQPGTVFTYQWRVNGTSITGATGPVYTPAAAGQVGQSIEVVVTGTRFGYITAARTSAPTGTVAAGDALSSTPIPTLPGTPTVGTVLVAVPGSWDDGVALSYTWQASGTNINGATAVAFTPTAAQLGQQLTVTVTGTKPGIPPVSKVSAASEVAPGTQVLQPTPTISGTARPDSPLVGVPGTWDAGTTRTYRWYVNGVEVAGNTTTTYTPTVDDIAKQVTFEVTGSRPGYSTVVMTSASTTVLRYAQTVTPSPTITGTPQVGGTLTAVPGTWDDGTSLAYQWSADGTEVDGATSSTFIPGVAQIGTVVTVRVTSTKPDSETVTRTSDPTTAVVEGDLVDTPVPTILGTPRVGLTLTAEPGAWDAGTTLAYQWLADDEVLVGSTSATFTPAAGQVGAVLTVKVTGTRTGYTTVSRTSAPTAAVAPGSQELTPVPVITGTLQVDATLAVVPGTWGDGTTISYQWFVAGAPVAGATGTRYGLSPADAGRTVSVTVTGTRTGYAPVTKVSAPTAVIALGNLTASTPAVTGTPRVGLTLTAETGAWSAGAALTYQWTRDGVAVAGATSTTYQMAAPDLAHRLAVVVTGSKAGYTTESRASQGYDVAAGRQTARPKPVITGVARVGRTLKARSATYDAGVRVSYRWTVGGQQVGTGKRLDLTRKLAGRRVRLVITAKKPGFAPVVRTSARTSKVAPKR